MRAVQPTYAQLFSCWASSSAVGTRLGRFLDRRMLVDGCFRASLAIYGGKLLQVMTKASEKPGSPTRVFFDED